jgi:hypothetical protein
LIAQTIEFLARNLPAVMLVVAVIAAALTRHPQAPAERFLAWLLLLPIGVSGLWAGLFHVVFPRVSADFIGWQVSPFQFEVGMADLGIGLTAVIAFWRSLEFKAAAVCVASVFLLGDAVGHVRDMVVAGNFAPGNAGVPFFTDVICPVAALALLLAAKRARAAEASMARPARS